VDEKGALDANTMSHTTHRDIPVWSAACNLDDGSLEDLDALAVALDDTGVYLDRVSRKYVRQIFLQLLLPDALQNQPHRVP
jgi:hypothetical protein